jgi:hypothetical protein
MAEEREEDENGQVTVGSLVSVGEKHHYKTRVIETNMALKKKECNDPSRFDKANGS